MAGHGSPRDLAKIARGAQISRPRQAGAPHTYKVRVRKPERVRAFVNSMLVRLAKAKHESAGRFRYRAQLYGSDTLAAWEEAMGQLHMPCEVVKDSEGVWVANMRLPGAVLREAIIPETTAHTVAVFPVEPKPN